MRDKFSCFSDNSVLVSQASCSNYSSNACIATALVPSVRNAVTSLYKTVLSTQKPLLIAVTWFRAHMGQDLCISFGDGSEYADFKLNTTSRFRRKNKGSRTVEPMSTAAPHIEIFWDLSSAKYDGGAPEPVDGFYVVAVMEYEIGLILGDMSEEDAMRKFVGRGSPAAAGVRCSLISRQEHCSGNTVYATRAQFSETGTAHDIVVRWAGVENENNRPKPPALSVSIDRKVVMRMKRLQWNFRGNQSIFIDGLLVDLMWDLHDWFFTPAPSQGYAVFMFRTRSGLDSRLWLEERSTQKEQDRVEFSLVIYASK